MNLLIATLPFFADPAVRRCFKRQRLASGQKQLDGANNGLQVTSLAACIMAGVLLYAAIPLYLLLAESRDADERRRWRCVPAVWDIWRVSDRPASMDRCRYAGLAKIWRIGLTEAPSAAMFGQRLPGRRFWRYGSC